MYMPLYSSISISLHLRLPACAPPRGVQAHGLVRLVIISIAIIVICIISISSSSSRSSRSSSSNNASMVVNSMIIISVVGIIGVIIIMTCFITRRASAWFRPRGESCPLCIYIHISIAYITITMT